MDRALQGSFSYMVFISKKHVYCRNSQTHLWSLRCNVMTEGKVSKWVRDFKDGCENIHNEACSARPPLITDELVASVEVKIHEYRRFTITTLSDEFPDVSSRSVIYTIVSGYLNFKKLRSHWVILLMEKHKTKRYKWSSCFLTRYDKEGHNMLNQIGTGDKTWVSRFMPETKQQSMEWKHTISHKGQG